MKKYLLTLTATLMVALMSFCVISCGGDDDDDLGDGTGVVGVWDGTSGGDKVVATFKSNGTGTLDWVTIDDGTYYEKETFTYVKDSDNSGTMTVKYADSDDSSGGSDSGSSTYIVKYSISGDTMILRKASTGSVLASLTRRTN